MLPFWGWHGSVGSVVVVIAVVDNDAHGGCSWGELSNVAWSYATRGLCGMPGVGLMMMFLANEATSQILSSVADRIWGDGEVGKF